MIHSFWDAQNSRTTSFFVLLKFWGCVMYIILIVSGWGSKQALLTTGSGTCYVVLFIPKTSCFSLTIYLVFRVRVNQRERRGVGRHIHKEFPELTSADPPGKKRRGWGGRGVCRSGRSSQAAIILFSCFILVPKRDSLTPALHVSTT